MYNNQGTVSFVLFILCLIAIVFSIVSLSLSTTTMDSPSTPERKHPLALDDHRVQTLTGPDQWTDILYRAHRHHSPYWHHTSGSADITSLHGNLYTVYLSVQVDTSEPLLVTSKQQQHHRGNSTYEAFACRRCNLVYEIRALLGTEEVPVSRTFALESGQRFLSKSFLVHVSRGQVLRMQFRSPCSRLILTNSTEGSHRRGHSICSSTLIIE